MPDPRAFLNSFINFESKLHLTASSDFTLDPIRTLFQRLGRPERNFGIVHVAGTKGKGSTSAMIASMLREAGLSVGLYTSPHLWDVRERIRILRPGLDLRSQESQDMFADAVTEADLGHLVERLRGVTEEVHRSFPQGLTYFEVLTALAVCYFSDERVNWVVLETGLGGRLDATNIVEADEAVITSIGLDHQHLLGDTIAEIAAEKAGIIKNPNQRVVIAMQTQEAAEVIERHCRQVGVDPIWITSGDVDAVKDWPLSLRGGHQRVNAATAVRAVEVLGLNISQETMRSALEKVFWPGRFEVIGRQPDIVLDCAHNEDSIRALLETVASVYPGRRLVCVFGCSLDKNIGPMAALLKNAAEYVILTRCDHPRARRFSQEDIVREFDPARTTIFSHVDEALQEARRRAGDVTVVTGSVFLVAQARKILMGR